MTTKERIVDEALSLFSVNGYKGTTVKSIADAVGIKDSSLYKHFKSKQEILDTIVATMWSHIADMSNAMGLPADDDVEQAVSFYASLDENLLVELSNQIFLFYLKDSFVSRFWRMGTIEQFQNPEVYRVFRKLFMEESIAYQAGLFGEMIKQGIFIEADPQVMAVYFYTPIYFLLSKYTNDLEHTDEALGMLDKQVREFYKIYRKG